METRELREALELWSTKIAVLERGENLNVRPAQASGQRVNSTGVRGTPEPIFGLTTTNGLVIFDSATPGTTSSPIPVTGLTAGTTLVGMDFRPVDRQLVAVGNVGGAGTVYTIDPATGAATAINSGFTLSGSAFGVDFNPVPNALRIVSDADQNLRIVTGGAGTVNTDGALNPGDPNVVGAAYTNNFPGATQTTLYDIDSVTDRLFTQGSVNGTPVSPNTGTLLDVAPLGFNTSDLVGFDISRGSTIAYASLTAPGGALSQLFTIDLGTGAATLIGSIGSGLLLRDITVSQVMVPEPGTLAPLGLALAGLGFSRKKSS